MEFYQEQMLIPRAIMDVLEERARKKDRELEINLMDIRG